MRKFGHVQKKILLGVLGGVVLGLSSSPRKYFQNLRRIKKEWKSIDQYSFERSLKKLSNEKLVEEKRLADGSLKLILTVEGKKQARRLNLLGSSINFKKPDKWDKKWRVVIFDIPEKDRIFRNILREHLKELKFKKLQNSVFVSPYPFEKMILELVQLYSAEKYIRVITATRIDNENKLKALFFK